MRFTINTLNKVLQLSWVFGIALIVSLGNVSAETRLISGGLGAPNSHAAVAAKKFTSLVKERSNGRIIISHYPGGTLGKGQEQMEAVSSGTQHLFISAGSQASRMVKAFGIIDTAFLFKDFAHLERFMASDMGQELNNQLIEEFGVRIVASNWYALPRYLMHRSKFITSLDDVKDVRTRTASVPMFIQNYKNMGAIPVKIAYGEQYIALSQGVVDMTESAANRILHTKLYEVAPYITEADMMFPQVSVFFNEKTWRTFSLEDQNLISKAAIDAGRYYSNLTNSTFKEEKKQIISKGGKFERMPDALRQAFAEKTKINVGMMEGKGLLPKGWFDKILALRNP